MSGVTARVELVDVGVEKDRFLRERVALFEVGRRILEVGARALRVGLLKIDGLVAPVERALLVGASVLVVELRQAEHVLRAVRIIDGSAFDESLEATYGRTVSLDDGDVDRTLEFRGAHRAHGLDRLLDDTRAFFFGLQTERLYFSFPETVVVDLRVCRGADEQRQANNGGQKRSICSHLFPVRISAL